MSEAPHPRSTGTYLRYGAAALAAVSLSFLISTTVLPFVSASLASVAAMSTLRPTVHGSLKEMFKQGLGILLGAVLALPVSALLAERVLIALPLSLMVGLAVCWVLRIQVNHCHPVVVPIVLIVAGGAFSVQDLEARAVSVLCGGVIAVTLSYAILPGKPTRRTLDGTIVEATRIAGVVEDVAAALKEGQLEKAQIAGWNDTVESAEGKLQELRADAEESVRSARWAPSIEQEEADAVLAQVRLTQQTTNLVAEMVEDIRVLRERNARRGRNLPDELSNVLAGALEGVAELISEQAKAADEDPAVQIPATQEFASEILDVERDSARIIRSTKGATPLILGGSVLRDSERIRTILSNESKTGKPEAPPQTS